MNSFICHIAEIQTSTSNLRQSGPGSNYNEEVLHIP